MPVMDGIKATQELRRRGFDRLIIAVTGNVLDDEADEFLEAGADIGKPNLSLISLSHTLTHTTHTHNIFKHFLTLPHPVFPKPFRKVFLDALLTYVGENGSRQRTKLTISADTGALVPRS